FAGEDLADAEEADLARDVVLGASHLEAGEDEEPAVPGRDPGLVVRRSVLLLRSRGRRPGLGLGPLAGGFCRGGRGLHGAVEHADLDDLRGTDEAVGVEDLVGRPLEVGDRSAGRGSDVDFTDPRRLADPDGGGEYA